MEAGPIKLLKLLGENKNTFNIPVYQRNYEWNKEQVEQFFKDIVNIIEDNYEIRHFLGTVVFVSNEKPGLMMERIIIDGQQRITTTILLLKAIYDLLDENDGFKNEIYETYIINKYVEDEYKLKLKPVEGDMQAFVDLMNESPTIKESKIFTNYSLFVDLIERSNYSAREIYEALSLVEIVYISLDRNSKKENPQIIFESLNSTGLSLTEADLIRNFILMGLSYDEQTRLYKKYWLEIEKMLPNVKISEFVRDYLTMKTGHTPNKNKVYFEFKKNYFKNSYTSENILKDLLKYARYYYWFINVNTNDNEINKWLEKLNYMKSTVVYPYLLELFDDYFQKKILIKKS